MTAISGYDEQIGTVKGILESLREQRDSNVFDNCEMVEKPEKQVKRELDRQEELVGVLSGLVDTLYVELNSIMRKLEPVPNRDYKDSPPPPQIFAPLAGRLYANNNLIEMISNQIREILKRSEL